MTNTPSPRTTFAHLIGAEVRVPANVDVFRPVITITGVEAREDGLFDVRGEHNNCEGYWRLSAADLPL